MRYKTLLLTAVCATSLLATSVFAQEAVLKTGGKTGDYYLHFAPPLAHVLTKAWVDVVIDTSGGTPDNMDYLLDHQKSYALAQGDVYATLQVEPRYHDKYKVLSAAIGSEAVLGIMSEQLYARSQGSWAVTARHARQVRFAMPSRTSGPGRTFQELQALDPNGLGQATNVTWLPSVDDAIKAVGDGTADATLLVQFPNPENPRFQAIKSLGLHVVPVIAQSMKGLEIPSVGPAFNLCENVNAGTDTDITTACTPILVITGATNDNPDLDKVFHEVRPEDFAPQQSGFRQFWSRLKTQSGAAWKKAAASAEAFADNLKDRM